MTALAKIHIAKKQLAIGDDDYRALLARVTGKTSAREMSESERGRVLAEFNRMGFKPVSGRGGKAGAQKAGKKRLEGKYAPKLQALWIGAWNLGIVRERSDAALLAFVKRQTGIDHVRFLRHEEDAHKAIEALKKWMAREAGVDWSVDPARKDRWHREPGYKIAVAQYRKAKAMFPDLDPDFESFVFRVAGTIVPLTSRSGWMAVMNELGRIIRGEGL